MDTTHCSVALGWSLGQGQPPVDPGAQGQGQAAKEAARGAEIEAQDTTVELPEEMNPEKIGICHRTKSESNPAVFIIVSENAADAHERHGDVMGVAGAEECEGVAPATPGAGDGDDGGDDGTPEPEDGVTETVTPDLDDGTPTPGDGTPLPDGDNGNDGSGDGTPEAGTPQAGTPEA